MKKEKIIRQADYSILAAALACFIWWLLSYQTTFLGLTVILFVFAILLNAYREKLKEDKNPLNNKRISEALSYCSESRRGVKSDFINLYGQEMYDLFLSKGYIHEPFEDYGTVWELTKLGLRMKTQFSS